MGSSLALYHFLAEQGLEVQVITPTDYAPFIHWLPGNDKVLIYENHEEKAKEITDNADIIFCLDFNDLSRINEYGDVVAQASAIKVMIDHHRDPSGFEDYRFWTIDVSSTCELIYDFIDKCGGVELIDETIGVCLYTGIIADTGSFRFSSTSPKTHEIAAELKRRGVNTTKIHELLYDTFSLRRYRLMGYVLQEKLKIFPQYKTALVVLSHEDLAKFNVQTGDTEGFVNFGLGIEGIKLSALIIDRTKLIKMSFRSKGDFPCNELAAKYFNGGGHLNASGGFSKESLEEVEKTFMNALPEFKKWLDQ